MFTFMMHASRYSIIRFLPYAEMDEFAWNAACFRLSGAAMRDPVPVFFSAGNDFFRMSRWPSTFLCWPNDEN